jgi:hypothetical protein
VCVKSEVILTGRHMPLQLDRISAGLEADVKTTLFNLEDLMTEICVNTEYAVVENEMYVKVLH